MPTPTAADTIRILVATDNHVGYNERDAIRGDDSSRTFNEIMGLATEQDVDMVLLAGDLFHDNKPSRKSLYEVMKSLRKNCLGDKPCELEMLSDGSEVFSGAFNHANYEDPNINVAIPVFSIHGNHDDPSGEGDLAALDLLQVSGLVNYYGKTPQSDMIEVKPVLLQKGRTKLALYGMSNVRDERLFRTFRDRHVTFFQPGDLPGVKKTDWFNVMSVHQNHVAHTETSYLPENFLPDFLDLVIWGHEHECEIEPRYNPEMSFHVMQPGSSVATSLMPGEAVTKHVAILSITGKEFNVEPIRLKTVRPFVMREVVLAEEKELKGLSKKEENRTAITRHLTSIVEDMISEGRRQWTDNHDGEQPEKPEDALPLIRLRVEYSAPEGGRFDCENPQRFSNRFVGLVANVNDVVQFHRKKATLRRTKTEAEAPDESVIAQITLDSVRVEKLVKEFLSAQSLTILPQNSFGDAVSQFVDKDDKHAMEMFVNDSLSNQVKHLLTSEEADDDTIAEEMDKYRAKLEELFASGVIKRRKPAKLKPKPDNWDSDLDGAWEDQAGAVAHSEDGEENGDSNFGSIAPKPPASRGRGRGRGGGAATSSTRKTTKQTTSGGGARGRKRVIEEESGGEESDVVMVDNDEDEDEEEEEEEEELFVRPKATSRKATSKPAASTRSSAKPEPPKKPAASTRSSAKPEPPKKPATRQSTLNFPQPTPRPTQSNGTKRVIELSDDEISDDDAFEPVSSAVTKPKVRR